MKDFDYDLILSLRGSIGFWMKDDGEFDIDMEKMMEFLPKLIYE